MHAVGTVHVLSDYDYHKWKNGTQKVVRKYLCPEPNCKETGTDTQAILKHLIRSHTNLKQQQVLFYLIQMNEMTGEPDYTLSRSSIDSIGDSSSSGSHSGEKRTDDSQAGGRGKREKKQRKNGDDQHNSNAGSKQMELITALEAKDDRWFKFMEKHDQLNREAQDKRDQLNRKAQEKENQLNREAQVKQTQLIIEGQEKQTKMLMENQTQAVQLLQASVTVLQASNTPCTIPRAGLTAADLDTTDEMIPGQNP